MKPDMRVCAFTPHSQPPRGHLCGNVTAGKAYRAEPVHLGCLVVNHWIVDDTGARVLISARQKRQWFSVTATDERIPTRSERRRNCKATLDSSRG